MSNKPSTDATGVHIDAETLAAWADHGLSAEAAAAVELHLSNCDRCQDVLGAFVRSTPAAGAVVIPFWARRPVQWSAAGLAAAAALVAMVWIGRPPAVPAPESTVARGTIDSITPPTPSASAPGELRRDKPASAPVAPRKEESASASDLRRDKPSSTLQDRAAANDTASKKATGSLVALPPAAMPAPASPPPRPVAAQAPPPTPVTVSSAAPVVAPVGAARAVEQSQAFSTEALTMAPPIEIVAPEPSAAFRAAVGAGRGGAGARAMSPSVVPARWRIIGGVHVQRSMDAGTTWTELPIEPALTTPLRAGVATSQFNCWLVGRAGVVLVTNDGLTFRRVSLPESVQLVSVIATDTLRATVTAVDGRTFSTIDGGLTWK